MAQGRSQAIAFGQPVCTGLDAAGQVATGIAGQTVGLRILQGAGVFLAQTDGFG
ncbi:hypothetical protein D3C71_2176470 [compost metagenome]